LFDISQSIDGAEAINGAGCELHACPHSRVQIAGGKDTDAVSIQLLHLL
jgi:tRNA(Glu) U13 pseudouridine synthase TruD